MRIICLLRIFLLSAIVFSCKTRRPSSEELPISKPSINLAEQEEADSLAKRVIPSLFINDYPIGTYKAKLISVTQLTPGDFYQYSVCSIEDPDNCQMGRFPFGSKLLANLNPGRYRLSLESCIVISERNDNACSEPVSDMFLVPANQDSNIRNYIQKIFAINQQIKNFSPLIYEELNKLREKLKQDQPNSQTEQYITNLIVGGEDVIGMILNSPQYEMLRLSLSEYQTLKNNQTGEEVSSTVDPDMKQQLEENAAKLKEIEERLKNEEDDNEISNWGSALISLGSISALSGIILIGTSFGVNYLKESQKSLPTGENLSKYADDTVKNASEIIRKLFHMPQGYVNPLRPGELEEHINQLNEKITNEADRYKKKTKEDIVVWEKSGKIEYIGVGEATYKIGDSLFEVNLNPDSYKTITIAEWEKLPSAVKRDYRQVGEQMVFDENKVIGKYFELDGKLYKRYIPKSEDKFPKLDEETIARFYNRKATLYEELGTKLKTTPNFDPESEWVKGVPMLDEQGRLVEPPLKWRVAGENWFYGPDGKGEAKDVVIKGKKFTAADRTNPDKVFLLPEYPELKITGDLDFDQLAKKGFFGKAWEVAKGAYNWRAIFEFQQKQLAENSTQLVRMGTEDLFWKVELSLKMTEYDLRYQANNVKAPYKNFQTNSAKKFDTITKYSRFGGIALLIIGVAAASIGAGFGLAQEDIWQLLKTTEQKIENLQKQRLKILQELKAYLNHESLPMPADDYWIYLL